MQVGGGSSLKFIVKVTCGPVYILRACWESMDIQ